VAWARHKEKALSDNASAHRYAWDGIPWVVNGTASEVDQRSVEAHVLHCDECREELTFQRRIHAAMTLVGASGDDAEHAWEHFSSRLAEKVAPEPSPGRGRTRLVVTTSWVAAASLAVAVFAVLRTAHLQQPSSMSYQTLAAPENVPPPASIRVVFAPTITLQQLQSLLSETGLTVVGGPSEAGVWELAPIEARAPDADAALRLLRASSAVRFAEPAGADR
jgi:hypothetical protein